MFVLCNLYMLGYGLQLVPHEQYNVRLLIHAAHDTGLRSFVSMRNGSVSSAKAIFRCVWLTEQC